jgi:hypothetical protein
MKRFLHSETGERGWYIGPFERAIFRTDACEVAYQYNRSGERSPAHTHRVAKEINLITAGKVCVSGETFGPGQGFIMEPGDICECLYLEDTQTVVVKVPGVSNDKYLV